MKLQLPKTFLKFLIITVLFLGQIAFGQLAQWPLTANGNPTSVDANATATTFVKGAGIGGSITYGTTGAFVSGWSTGAIDLTDYFEVTIAPNASYSMNVTQFNFSERRSGTGIRNYQVRWSVDDFSTFTTIATVNVPDNTSERNGSITGLNIDVADGEVLKFRIYGYTSEEAGGTWRINDGTLNIVGTVTPAGPAAPTVTTTSNSGLEGTVDAFLTGTINANGTTTDASFEYGTTVAYGSTATATPSSVTGTTTTDIDAYISSLSLNTQYHYRAVGTVSAVPTNGDDMTFYTLAATPGVLVVDNALQTTLDVTVDATTENSNPSITEYAIQETGGQYVQGDGTLGATAVWQTAATWATVTVTGLSTSTLYTFSAKAKNGANVETVFGGTASGTTLTPATVDWCNLQWPTSQTIEEGNTFTVYARVNEPGITDSPGEGTAIDAWIGYSATNGTPDGTWTWVSATYFGDDGANNDEYSTLLGSGITPGTYYYASRFSISGGPFVYGGINNAIWSSTADNAVLTVNSNLVDFCNIQYPATGIITEGMIFDVYAQVYEPTVTEAAGQGAGITAEIGYSTSDVAPDGTWTWLSAGYHADGVDLNSNNDEYKATLSGLAPGTYYYASRFIKTGSSEYVYGGTNGSPWTTSGVLTVNALGTPTATAGTLVGSTSFTANWDAVTDATSYEIDVYEETTSVASDLFISEYVEGSSNNKYIEIYNGTGASVDLSDYDLAIYANGNTFTGGTLALSGSLANGATFVIRNNSATVWGGTSDISTGVAVMTFNGNDVIALRYLGTNIDVVGTIGNAANFAANTTLTRNSSVSSPTTTYSSSDWATSASDTVSDLGSHTFSGGTSTTYVLQDFNVGDVTSYEVTGLNPETTYHYVVRAVLGATVSGNSNVIDVTTELGSCTWDGSAWSNVTGPTVSIAAIIEGAYDTTTSGGFTAKAVTINTGGSLTVNSGDTVTIVTGLTNSLTAAAVVVENNGNLIQEGVSNQNSGDITVKRFSSALKRQDYTLWSSPVAGQELQSFSPGTLSTRFYTYDTSADQYAAVATPSATDFATATGYLIRMPNVYPTTATVWTDGAFFGVPNSGDYTHTMTDGGAGFRFNLVGNPYPSPIDAVAFVENTTNAANTTGTLYFWRKTNNAASPSYCTWTTGGFVSNGEAQVYDPNDVIQTGQGFFVEASGNGTDLVFDNTMRTDDHVDQFFRTSSAVDRNRIWLNATGANGLFSQAMVGYMSDATNGYDTTIDGKYINDGAIALTSLIEATPYTIQGRSLPFDATDIVPMQFKAAAAGTYSIAIDHVDGLFAGAQDIFLRDTQTGVDHDLKASAYTFSSEAGTFANRFFVVYTGALSVDHPTLDANAVVVYNNENQSFTINSGAIEMASVKVFDIRGRLLTTQNNINASETTLTAGQSNEVLLVQVTSVDGATVTKKVVR